MSLTRFDLVGISVAPEEAYDVDVKVGSADRTAYVPGAHETSG